jgi:hypothetical protein
LSLAIYRPAPGKQTAKITQTQGEPADQLSTYREPAKLTAEHVSHDLLGPVKVLITAGWRKPFL